MASVSYHISSLLEKMTSTDKDFRCGSDRAEGLPGSGVCGSLAFASVLFTGLQADRVLAERERQRNLRCSPPLPRLVPDESGRGNKSGQLDFKLLLVL